MAYSSTATSNSGKKLIVSVAVTLAIFAGVYYVFQNYDQLFNKSQENTSVGAAQADPINGTFVTIQDLNQNELYEVIKDTKAVGYSHVIIANTFVMEKDCKSGVWKTTPLYNDPKFWATLNLVAAQKQQVYLGLGELRGTCIDITKGGDTAVVLNESKKQFSELYTQLVSRKLTAPVIGVYIPQDAWVADMLLYDNYYTNIASIVKQKQKSLKVLISPFRGTQSTYDAAKVKEVIARFVKQTMVDIIAPQLSMGDEGYSVSATSEYLYMWRNAIDLSNRSIDLWGNVELFDKTETNGKQVITPAKTASLVERINVAIPYVSSITSFSHQYYMTTAPALISSQKKFLGNQQYSLSAAILRYKLAAGYLMHYKYGRDIMSEKWNGNSMTVVFSDKKYDGSAKISANVYYLTKEGAFKTATAIKPTTKIINGQWQFTVTTTDLAQVDTNMPVGVFIKVVGEKE